MKLSSGKNTQMILLIALIAALIFAVYYYVVLPKQSDADSLNRSVNDLNNEISTLQSSITQIEADRAQNKSNIFALRKKVPQTREVDELLLNIEEIEYVTNSFVSSIAFNNYDSSAADAGIGITVPEAEQAPEDGTVDPNTNNLTETDTENTEGEPVDETAPENSSLAGTLPPELKLISFSLQVESPDYVRLLRFIDEIENLERIMHVDSISFSLPGEEVEFMEEEPNSVSASIQVTTFYYEGE
ncbi:hypothetical protein CD30_07395 [Ureibacillus massiliensis 4400831 = CIP 108448 = CCUG 49529]|uniref:Potassium transporter n=1 Tax=Ureibacillus massiliensis 4400831 = CIP 108448 = CCUG 49529 TaxID=1211035 RepID=A0A0A3J2V4_9BACL|nr:hypothetical protein [Ureibacillus massiliensis]KGR91256.1 hypothetical protein CD30_07395 [Ureibacillus massiliensis 4400831 = CIP 108448 = CCUG 49529]